MGLFGGNKNAEEQFVGVVGVDIGTSGIKMVELTPEKGRPKLSTYGYSDEKTPSPVAPQYIDNPEAAAEVLRSVYKEGRFRATKAVAALPGSEVSHAIITLPVPRSAKEDLKPLIEAQARKFLPLPLEEMILDSQILDKNLLPKDEKSVAAQADLEMASGNRKFIRVLVTGAPKTLVTKYVAAFKAAKLELTSLETEVFAVTRSLVGKDKSRIMIVDIGAHRTNITIVDQGVPYLSRGIRSGGAAITQALASGMNTAFDEAESMKRDLGFRQDAGLPKPLEEALKPIVHEMKYAIQLYADQEFHENKSVEKVILTGGSALLPGLVDHFVRELGLNVYIGDPWARIASPMEARGVLEEVGTRMAVAAGLALRAFDTDKT
ncbi:type IV pilus assembly protein PilM [Patescibacteria group bacterium]|nr:type IV pilus assembly protein PilM [Patescibacteria group bacterium]